MDCFTVYSLLMWGKILQRSDDKHKARQAVEQGATNLKAI